MHDLARLAHHADAAGDEAAVREFAPAAARDAAARGAHRQAAEQWARALRQPAVDPAARAALLEAYAWEAQLTGWMDDSIDARRKAVRLWREIGDRDHEAVGLSLLAVDFIVAGRNPEGEATMGEALALVEPGGGNATVAIVLRCSAYLRMLDRDAEVAIREAGLAMAIAERLGDHETVVFCRNAIGSSMIVSGRVDEGRRHLESGLTLAERCSSDTGVASALGNLGSACGEVYCLDLAESYLQRGIRYCLERDLDRWRYYQMAWLALVEMYRGRWDEAAASAHAVLEARASSGTARMMALIALGRVRARRGDPGVWEALDEAGELAGQSGTLQRVAPMLAARAEASWLEGRASESAALLDDGLALAVRKRHTWFAAELLYWRSMARGSPPERVPDFCAGNPFALEAIGRSGEAAAAWHELGCPYEQARALSQGDELQKREALAILESLGARPLAERVRHELRASGVRGLRRGPRDSTRGHPAGLTGKEVDVLVLLSAGLRNKDIAQRLHRSVRTIDHHVAAIFEKVGATNRAEAVSAAHRLGLVKD
jgi:DNA-binding CsgD family transcriptional regulator/tetratricopeptide (TPR) repeat protein